MSLIKFLDLKEWDANHSSVWREIVSRFGQSDYDDETLRAKHKETLKAEWDALDFARKRQKEGRQMRPTERPSEKCMPSHLCQISYDILVKKFQTLAPKAVRLSLRPCIF